MREPTVVVAELPRLLFLPFIWSITEALFTAELSTAFPGNGGFVIWGHKASSASFSLSAGGGAPSVSEQGKKRRQPSVGFVSGGLAYAATVSTAVAIR